MNQRAFSKTIAVRACHQIDGLRFMHTKLSFVFSAEGEALGLKKNQGEGFRYGSFT
jgi:hypothetical protein